MLTAEPPAMKAPLLEFRGVMKRYGSSRTPIWALAGINLTLFPGETLGIVGESGSGKSTIARIAVGLEAPTLGDAILPGPARNRHDGSSAAQMVFQDPAGSLDPLFRVGRSVREPLDATAERDNAKAERRAVEALAEVGLIAHGGRRFPGNLSGGQKQRVSIARALAALPPMIVCDEAVTALDVSIRAQVLNLLRRIQNEHGTSYLFISHDLCTVTYMSDRIMVLYLGKVMEELTTEQLLSSAGHPYTHALLSAVPALQRGSRVDRGRLWLMGEPPSIVHPPAGCRFHTRCPLADARCREEEPALRKLDAGHLVACHYAPVSEAALAKVAAEKALQP